MFFIVKLQRSMFFFLSVGISFATVFIFSCSSDGGHEQNSSSEHEQSSSSAIVCNGIEYNPYSHFCSYEGEIIAKGEITDVRDGKVYKIVTIGTQTWMAENLNYNASDSRCYDDDPVNCEKYGRLYYWESAMEACPEGWHLPSEDEWRELVNFAGFHLLRAINNWPEYGPLRTDRYGFSALPGGYKTPGEFTGEGFFSGGDSGYWWNASVSVDYDIGGVAIITPNQNVLSLLGTPPGCLCLCSVRCVEDYL